MKLKSKSEHELLELEDDDLIGYAVRCRDAGDADAFRTAISIFVNKRSPMVRARVALKVPPGDVEDLVGTVIVSAIASISTIEGSLPGEFVNWLKAITRFRIADYYREREGDPDLSSADAAGREDERWLEELVDTANDIDAVPVIDAYRRVLGTRSPVHGAAIELRVQGYSSRETADEINRRMEHGLLERGNQMSPPNVDQLLRRFRLELAADLDGEDRK